jgi:hypothetical protein
MVEAEQQLLAVVDSGASASMCYEGAPLGNKAPAGALVTGATSAAPVTAASVGSLTVVAGEPGAPVHVWSPRMFELSSLPKGMYLFSLSEMLDGDWRLKQRADKRLYLESPPTADHHRLKLDLAMVKGILKIPRTGKKVADP